MMAWEFAFLGTAVAAFVGAFVAHKWSREVRTPEKKNPVDFSNPGSGGA